MTKSLDRNHDHRPLLERILDTPHLAHIVPRLPPEMLHKVIQHVGLEACGELVTLATPEQLARVFDLDLWRAAKPTLDEQFDADRFGVWLEVLLESGDDVAAHTVAKMDAELVVTALARHIRVFDPATLTAVPETDDEPIETRRSDGGQEFDVGGYLVSAKATDSVEAIIGVLVALDREHGAYFHRVMRGCRRLSNSAPEIDGLDDLLGDQEQGLFDLAVGRERRRDQQGYVTSAQARAFLKASRQLRLAQGSEPPADPVARAYFRAIEPVPVTEESAPESPLLLATSGAPPSEAVSNDALGALVGVLLEAGVIPAPPRALLAASGPESPDPTRRLSRMQAQMTLLADGDPFAFSMRSQELAYLANTLLAGCVIQARPFTVQEASDAAVAVCNLGLENWPAGAASDSFLVSHDLVGVFQVGWTTLYQQVCFYTAERLIAILKKTRHPDPEVRIGLAALRAELTKHVRDEAPWRGREALDVFTSLDAPAWAALVGLIDECPVIHAGLAAGRDARTRSVDPSAFVFISENSQIASVHAFMDSLPAIIGGDPPGGGNAPSEKRRVRHGR